MRVCTIWTTTSTICGISVGRAWAMPMMREAMICIPASTSCGSSSSRAATSSVMTCSTTGSSAGIALMMPSASARMMDGALSRTAAAIMEISSTACGIISVTVSTTEVMPFFSSSPACSFPATRSERPSMIMEMPGSSSPTMRFFRPPIVPWSRVRLSSKFAEAATASLLMTIP